MGDCERWRLALQRSDLQAAWAAMGARRALQRSVQHVASCSLGGSNRLLRQQQQQLEHIICPRIYRNTTTSFYHVAVEL
uniref:Uncharacterized protein n=1 Tax=Oryza nivara TaxID=4536 RepID=A0A0E0FW13_ORYNI